MSISSKTIGRFAGPAAFASLLAFARPAGLSAEGVAVAATAVWIAIWWITEAMPMAATALLPIVLFPLTGGLELAATTSSYGHRYVFLYIGGFLLAIAMEKWNLHKRIALSIIRSIGTDARRLVLGFMVATASLSMWISNTATTVMMLPIGMAIVAQRRDTQATDGDEPSTTFGKALMLGVAYSASIGGIATLIGTPTNVVLAGMVEELYATQIGFGQWMRFGLPVSVLLLFLCYRYLTRIAFDLGDERFPGGREEVERQYQALGRLGREEAMVLVVFVLMALSWVGRRFLQEQLGLFPRLDDTVIAMVGGLAMFVMPARNAPSLLVWEDSTKLPWGIILLFGGGMALAEGFKTSGLAAWIGGQLAMLDGVSLFVWICVLVAMVNFLTEITSNIATTAMLLPILAPLALALDVHPFLLMVSATVASSCAFMLPVATPPNAVVFGSGYLRISDMFRTGLWMNIASILVVAISVYLLLGVCLGIDPRTFPDAWK